MAFDPATKGDSASRTTRRGGLKHVAPPAHKLATGTEHNLTSLITFTHPSAPHDHLPQRPQLAVNTAYTPHTKHVPRRRQDAPHSYPLIPSLQPLKPLLPIAKHGFLIPKLWRGYPPHYTPTSKPYPVPIPYPSPLLSPPSLPDRPLTSWLTLSILRSLRTPVRWLLVCLVGIFLVYGHSTK